MPDSSQAGAAAPAGDKVLMVLAPGLYRCELNRRVTVRRVDPQARTLVINWLGRDSTLTAVNAQSGALRFENASAGLVWITIVGKSLLLDSKAGKTLANECKL